MTSEPQEGVFMRQFYVLIGRTTALFGFGSAHPVEVTFHVWRGLLTLVFGGVLYVLVANFIQSVFWRRFTFVFAMIGVPFLFCSELKNRC